MMKRVFFRKGPRVGLSVNFTDADTEFLIEHANNYHLTQFLMRRFPIYPEEEKEWIAQLHKHIETDQVFGIALVETGELIGMMGLHRIDWISRTATTGAWIASDENRSKGIGTEAKILLLDYAFNTLHLRKICSSVLATNTRSIHYNKKCGYRIEGTLSRHIAVYGEYVDEVRMAIFSEDFVQKL